MKTSWPLALHSSLRVEIDSTYVAVVVVSAVAVVVVAAVSSVFRLCQHLWSKKSRLPLKSMMAF